jgi:hypothetical protein
MARMSAAALDPNFAGGKVKLVMEHGDIAGGKVVKARGLAHRVAGEVHEGLRLE